MAIAQTAPALAPGGPPPAPDASGAAVGRPHRMRDRFATANTTGDGHLTLAQAQAAGMKGVVHDFDAIDPGHKGYVTLDEIRAFHRARHAGQAAPPPNGAVP